MRYYITGCKEWEFVIRSIGGKEIARFSNYILAIWACDKLNKCR
jgi:hypothetical protein